MVPTSRNVGISSTAPAIYIVPNAYVVVSSKGMNMFFQGCRLDMRDLDEEQRDFIVERMHHKSAGKI